MSEPVTREEQLLSAIATGGDILYPITRKEMFLAKLGGADVNTPTPITREEWFLQKAIENGGSGGSGCGTGDNVIWVGGSTSDGVANSVVGNGIIRYVTFKNHDGTVEYGRKSVIVGEDCVDPVAAGHMATPTRESTAQYNYTFSGGWATTPNGGKDANALKAVNEDRTVYANFVSALRYYTITFYDSDGTTVLATKSLAYGSTPSHTAEKEGFVFDAWVPELATVTGNASYTASWSENITFADATWADIVRVAEAGNAQKYFTLGDTKAFSCKDTNGNTVDITLVVAGFNKETKSDGSGTTGITIIAKTPLCKSVLHQQTSGYTYKWSTCNVRKKMNSTVLSSFPEVLQSAIKSVNKTTRIYIDGSTTNKTETTEDKVWLPSCREMGASTNTTWGVYPESGTAYSSTIDFKQIVDDVGNALWTRSGSTKNNIYAVECGTSSAARWTGAHAMAKTGSILIGFCI